MNWSEYPLLKPTVAFILGIMLQSLWTPSYVIIVSFIVITLLMIVILSQRRAKIKATLLQSILTLFLFIGLGWLSSVSKDIGRQPHHFSHHTTEKDSLTVRLLEDVIIKKSIKTFAEVQAINRQPATGKILVYFEKDSLSKSYQAGDIVVIRSNIQNVNNSRNPEAFNYKKYLSKLHIHHQTYVNTGQHRLIDKNQLSFAHLYATKIRRWGIKTIKQALPNQDEFAVATALILGEKSNLSDDIYRAYSETGAVHVLAVSGLHVGIITMIFVYLFKFIRSDKKWIKVTKLSVLLIIVWAYALITGGAPAVMRASLMFSLIMIGRYLLGNYYTFNILCASALTLLAYDPMLLYQLSFQFSYIALTSILLFYNVLFKHFVTDHKVLNKLISLVLVSIAAQILMFPMTIYYFHQLPTYFIISGVFAVFLAPFILSLGILTLASSIVTPLFKLCSTLLHYILWIFIKGIKIIHELPYNTIGNLWLEPYQLILLYTSIGAIVFFIYKKRMVTMVFISLICMILLITTNIYTKHKNTNTEKLTVYDTSKEESYMEIYKNKISSEHSSNGISEKSVQFIANNHRIKYGIKSTTAFVHKNGVFDFGNYICYLPSINNSKSIPKNSDYILLTNGYDKPPKYTLKYHSSNFVVIDSSIPYWNRLKWLKHCKKYNIAFHDIKESGSFILENYL